MNRRIPSVLIGSFVLGTGWGCSDEPTGPGNPFCGDQPEDAIATFDDPNLEAAIRATLSLLAGDGLTCGLLSGLTEFSAASSGIQSLAGIENLTGLTTLWIRDNSITHINPLSGLTKLSVLNLAANSITDVNALGDLTSLTFLAINDNGGITDIGPLSGLTSLTGSLWISGNSISDISALSQLTGLTTLNAWDNSITDVSALSGLASLTEIRLHFNSITDIGGLGGLPNLALVWLNANPDLSDVQPLLNNPALGAGFSLNLTSTSVTCADVAALEARGILVASDCS